MSVSEYAVLSSAVYSAPDRQAALDSITTSSKGKFKGTDYSVLEGDADYMVFRRLVDGRVVVACRGTRDTTDAVPDVFIALGLLRFHPRSKKILAVVDRYKYLGMDVSVTGHSLGGKLAALIGATEGVLAVTFNQGASPMDSNYAVVEMQENLFGYNYSNVVHVTTALDGVSTTEAIAQNNRTVIVTAPSYIDPLTNHGLASFLDMSNEDASKADGAIGEEDTRIRKEQRETPLVDDIDRQLKNARTYFGNSLNVYKTHHDYFGGLLGEDQIASMDALMAASDAGEITAEERAKEMLRVAFDDVDVSDEYKIGERDGYMTDAKLDKIIAEDKARIKRAREYADGDEFDVDLNESAVSGEAGGGESAHLDEFDSGLIDGEGLGADEAVSAAERRAIMSEEEFIDDLGAGVAGGSTAAARLDIFERNIKNMEWLPSSMREELLGKVAELRASQSVARALENVGMYKMARAVTSISTKLGAKWTVLMAKNVTFFGGRLKWNVGSVLKKLGKFLDVVMIIAQAAFLVSEILDIETIRIEMEKLQDNMKLPEFQFLRFKVKVALERMAFLKDFGTAEASIHGVELAVGIFVTCMVGWIPGLQGVAVAFWAGVAAEQLSEIPGDMIVSASVKAEYIQNWYGSPPTFTTHVWLRDRDARDAGEPGDVGNYLKWVAHETYLSSWSVPSWAVPTLDGFVAEIQEKVRVIVEDPQVENGIADNRYERLVQLQGDVPMSLWGKGLMALIRNGANRPELNTISDLIVAGVRGYVPTTLQGHHDLKRFTAAQRLKMLVQAGHEEYFISSGGKSKGDAESDEEYSARVNSWVDTQVRAQTAQAVARAELDYPEYLAREKARSKAWREDLDRRMAPGRDDSVNNRGVFTVDRGPSSDRVGVDTKPASGPIDLLDIPGAGDSNGDGSVCKWVPKKKLKPVTTPTSSSLAQRR